MRQAIETYLALRRTSGFELTNDDYLLHSYARFAAERGESHVHTTTAITWAAQSTSVAQRDARLKTVCRFARFVRLEDERHELPPAEHFACHKTRRLPTIYSDAELERLIKSALQLGPPGALRPHTYATLIALLSATGLRISEALALRLGDISSERLLIRRTKFRKSRLVPLHDTVVLGLERYLKRRCQFGTDHDCVFITDTGRPLCYRTVYPTFQKLLRAAKLWPAPGAPRPRLHDLRHRFAVRALETSEQSRASISQHMLALATYLGHVNINATYWYLEATPELLRKIATACEAFYERTPS
jgi:integrase/recombinase XerD